MTEPATEDDPIQTAWFEVLARWDDPQAHKRFVALCVALNRLPEAGQRYRAVRDDDPDRREAAEQHIEKLFALAVQTLEALKTPPPERTNRRVLFVAIGVAVTLLGALAWSLVRIYG